MDSFLGATLQYSGYSKQLGKVVNHPAMAVDAKSIGGLNVLTNNQVNFISAILTSIVSGFVMYSLELWK